MWTVAQSHRPALLLLAAAALVMWGVVGFRQGLHRGFSGGLYDPQYTVAGLSPGGLAERSGFKAGDRVVSVEGTPVERLGMESRWPMSLAPRIGQTLRFVVERNGTQVPVDVTYPAPFARAVDNRIAAGLIGLGFLVFGLGAYLAVKTPHARALAGIGLTAAASSALGLGPSLGSWNGVQSHLSTAASVLLYLLLLRFFVTFPAPKPVSRSRLAAWAVLAPYGGLLVFLGVELVVHPALYYAVGTVTAPLTLLYTLCLLAAILHTVATIPRRQRRATGMNLIVGGIGVALVSMAVAFTGVVRWPAWTFALATWAIPLSMALAVRRAHRPASEAGASPTTAAY